MAKRTSNLPWIFLLLFPLAHVFAIGEFLPPGGESGYWSIGATVFFLMDVFLVLVLILLLYGSFNWKTRERILLVLTVLPVAFGVFGALQGTDTRGLLMLLVANGSVLLVVVLCWFWARKQQSLREKQIAATASQEEQ